MCGETRPALSVKIQESVGHVVLLPETVVAFADST